MPLGPAVVVAVAVAAVVLLVIRSRESSTTAVAGRRAVWGHLSRRPRPMSAIAGYDAARPSSEAPGARLDDRTWFDLNMDDVFGVVDRTESLIGRQVLYARLRASPRGPHPDAFESLVTRFSGDPELRDRVQTPLARLGDVADGSDLLGLAAPDAVVGRPWYALFPVLGATMVVALAAVPFWPSAILVLVAGVVTNLGLRATVAYDLRTAGRAFRQIGPLLAAADALTPIQSPDANAMTATFASDTTRLAPLRRIASWAGRDTAASASGELSGLILEYLNMAFCLDGNALYFGARHLRLRSAELRRVVHTVGEIDAAMSVASYRAGTPGWTRPVFAAAGSPLRLVSVRHPLVPDAVPNTLTLGPPQGVIVTGSNMSGKSTFLRTLGVSAILAQTIGTCTADAYEGPVLTVRSCIGRADDPSTGKSYYLVEVESVLSLLAATRSNVPHLLLFDELFRGTNAVERIAAGEAVLASLLEPPPGSSSTWHIVVAATHDQELVDLLASAYAAFHFADAIGEDGLTFDYRLRSGPSTTRNAIALLGLRGAPPSLVERAMARAAALDVERTR